MSYMLRGRFDPLLPINTPIKSVQLQHFRHAFQMSGDGLVLPRRPVPTISFDDGSTSTIDVALDRWQCAFRFSLNALSLVSFRFGASVLIRDR